VAATPCPDRKSRWIHPPPLRSPSGGRRRVKVRVFAPHAAQIQCQGRFLAARPAARSSGT
jgi:hypothetical protein